jgi:formate hydrogenlyase subunit 6/NADH:ubiquinone oxidoreductase subunit I
MITDSTLRIADYVIIESNHFQNLIDALTGQGYDIFGPTVRDGAIVYDEIKSVEDLPRGWTDEQTAGKYHLKRRNDEALFGYVVGPQSWKKYLHPPELRLWRAKREGNGFHVIEENHSIPKRAFIGVRACEILAITIQDKVFLKSQFVDASYTARRQDNFIVAVNCSQAGGNCFCVSMNTGPKAAADFDLSLTEVLENGSHYFVVEIGTEKGLRLLNDVTYRSGTEEELKTAEQIVSDTAQNMGKEMETNGIKELLYENSEHARWDEVAKRCLTCANCTMVCPTCFCTTIEDVTDLKGDNAERWRKWDSCFTIDFSYIHGGSVRPSVKSRYRQWITHKLASWQEQFGTSGCVGCGRCITWCPVGIDITEEVKAIRGSSSGSES